MQVVLTDSGRMNLLGLLLHSVVGRRLADVRHEAQARRLHGDVLVEAGGMAVTLRFGDDTVELIRGAPVGRPRAAVRGTLGALLDVSLGRVPVRAWVSGRLRISGRPRYLWRLLAFLRA